jgi:hypothetical protein
VRWLAVAAFASPLAGCDRLWGLFPTVEQPGSVDAITIDLPPPQACPSTYAMGLPPHISTSLYRIELAKPAEWYKAADICGEENKTAGSFTHLVVLSNDSERDQLAPYVPDSGKIWIGYSDVFADNQFEWVTAEDTHGYPTFGGPPWEQDDPDKLGPGCITLRSGRPATIGDTTCTDPEPFICECDGYADLPDRR